MPKCTINDIAKESGFSKATVSRVLNNPSSVDLNTREKILEIMRKRRYTPSALARNLSRQTSTIVGVIVPEVDNPFFGEILRGITSVVNKHNLTMICVNSDDKAENDIKALKMFKEQRVTGLLYTPAIDYSKPGEAKEILGLLQDLDKPVVIMDRKLDVFERYDGVYFDDRKSICEATEVLIKAGHTKIGIFNATMEGVLARIRQAGFRDALKKHHIAYKKEYCYLGNYTMTKSYQLACRMLESGDYPTAIITCNNRISMGFLKALREHSLRLSEDISCIGLDRIEALDIVGNEFNFIRREAKLMGQTAGELMIHRIAFPSEPVQDLYLNSEVVIRKL
ncbi:MAG: LacI family DNA-binding transcriptional regulator [Lachnospiraceae bacterium]